MSDNSCFVSLVQVAQLLLARILFCNPEVDNKDGLMEADIDLSGSCWTARAVDLCIEAVAAASTEASLRKLRF